MRTEPDEVAGEMTEPHREMHNQVSLGVRLVYEPSRETGQSDVAGWRLVRMLPDVALEPEDVAAGRVLGPPVVLTLSRDEAHGYYLNLTSPDPSLFVLPRLPDVNAATSMRRLPQPPESVGITVSYAEGARWMDGGMVVVRTALPEALLGWIAAFTQHHFPLEGPKKRGRFRPSFLSREEFGQEAARAMAEANRARRH
jgi:hypothetical protein